MAGKKNSYPVLKMPLNLSNAVDAEVHAIFNSFSNGVEAKNYFLSAVLYYSRSPLVSASNALIDALRSSDERFDEVIKKLSDIENKIETRAVMVSTDGASVPSVEPVFAGNLKIDASVRQELNSMKQKFKV